MKVDIEFKKLSYVAGGKYAKTILKSIYGTFRSGNLVGILGPSGSGKTSLLNVLAGHICRGVSGIVKVNGQPRNMRDFHKISCYIMQENILRQQMTVREAMTTAADLKLGDEKSSNEKKIKVAEVLKLIGLESSEETRTEHLSGGQSKRLAIALELLSDPPIVFLDEPTTGLDNVVMKQCMELLRSLTKEGRTVICTIHQPSDSILQLFDQVYFLSDGFCVYDGSVSQIVPFLSTLGLECPTTHSPADYIIELTHMNESNAKQLSTQINNGNHTTLANKIFDSKWETYSKCDGYPTSFAKQVWILLARMALQLGRNKLFLGIQLFHHLLSGVAVGASFYGVGNNATYVLANYKLFIGILLFYAYTHIMSPILLFPFEIELMKREYSNRWYSLSAYYTAITLMSMPLMIVLAMLFNVIIYILTDQPMEPHRFVNFSTIAILVALTSYGLGLTIGSIFSSTSGATVGSAIGICLLLLCIYGMGYGDTIEPSMEFFMFFSYLRHGLVGICCAVLQNRRPMNCDEIYCRFTNPDEVLELMGMRDASMAYVTGVLVGFLVVLRLAAFVALRQKVKPDTQHYF